MHEILTEYLAVHGYWVLFLWTFLEGEAGLILAGFFAFQGYFTLPGVILTALAGAFCGDQFYFYVGRLQGARLLRIFTFIARKFHKALRLIERYGTFVAFVSRYTYGFRIVLPIILGMTSFPASKFCWLNILSALAWSLIFSLAGYLFGKSASLFVEDVSRYEHQLLVILAVLIACMWLGHFVHGWWQRRPARARLRRMRHKGPYSQRTIKKEETK
ncbi:DedA family protein [Geobacter argillaceus]|uniref:Membrane protein DedA with SNARE-associated domain n=1 Tax=Geobacter argillaceus TaxID=345631 RepID=A0A562W881_9BACT|nr:DedA family protein [Geobacter argillaceus]TWJ26412.1 membrane protein DedA with SNARE-associated domain [Geobacter argillaceus]